MRDYNNTLFNEIGARVNNKEQSIIEISISENDIVLLQYHLTRDFYYAVIVDDYTFEIVDKDSLLEALYYQARLITMHALNWDAFEEALTDALNNFLEFKGICLLFKGKQLEFKLSNELAILTEVVAEINKQSKQKQISILLNQG